MPVLASKDWGWYVHAEYEGVGYFLGMNVSQRNGPGFPLYLPACPIYTCRFLWELR
jgi:hypothetical protein